MESPQWTITTVIREPQYDTVERERRCLVDEGQGADVGISPSPAAPSAAS